MSTTSKTRRRRQARTGKISNPSRSPTSPKKPPTAAEENSEPFQIGRPGVARNTRRPHTQEKRQVDLCPAPPTHIFRQLSERGPLFGGVTFSPRTPSGAVHGCIGHVDQVPTQQVFEDHQALVEPLREEDLKDAQGRGHGEKRGRRGGGRVGGRNTKSRHNVVRCSIRVLFAASYHMRRRRHRRMAGFSRKLRRPRPLSLTSLNFGISSRMNLSTSSSDPSTPNSLHPMLRSRSITFGSGVSCLKNSSIGTWGGG